MIPRIPQSKTLRVTVQLFVHPDNIITIRITTELALGVKRFAIQRPGVNVHGATKG